MSQTLVVGSAAILSFLAYGYCTQFWFRLWHGKKSGSAHAFFLMSASLMTIVILKMVQLVTRILAENPRCGCPYEIAIWILLFFNSFFHFAFARGYFQLNGGRNVNASR